jgi:hypothetical protein
LKNNKPTQSKFHISQKVSIITGTKDPDYGFFIGGWSGSIEEIIESEDGRGGWLYCILWDDKTLEGMDPALENRCEKDNLDFSRMVLAEHEIESN